MFSIHSANSDRELFFSDFDHKKFNVELRGFELSSNISVWYDANISRLDEFFNDLAQSAKPWNDARNWESLDGEFSIAATCSATGTVLFKIEFLHQAGNDEESFIRAGLITEFGQLVTIARNAVIFFN
jgi:hypothetical protein